MKRSVGPLSALIGWEWVGVFGRKQGSQQRHKLNEEDAFLSAKLWQSGLYIASDVERKVASDRGKVTGDPEYPTYPYVEALAGFIQGLASVQGSLETTFTQFGPLGQSQIEGVTKALLAKAVEHREDITAGRIPRYGGIALARLVKVRGEMLGEALLDMSGIPNDGDGSFLRGDLQLARIIGTHVVIAVDAEHDDPSRGLHLIAVATATAGSIIMYDWLVSSWRSA